MEVPGHAVQPALRPHRVARAPLLLALRAARAAFELVGLVLVVVGLAVGVVDPSMALLLLLASYGYGTLVTLAPIIVEEASFHRYERWRDLGATLVAVVAESLGYRQLTAVWRLQGWWSGLTGQRQVWGEMTRTGFVDAPMRRSVRRRVSDRRADGRSRLSRPRARSRRRSTRRGRRDHAADPQPEPCARDARRHARSRSGRTARRRARLAGDTPGPLSVTRTQTSSPSVSTLTSTVPASRVYLMALEIRFSITCVMRRASASTSGAARPVDEPQPHAAAPRPVVERVHSLGGEHPQVDAGALEPHLAAAHLAHDQQVLDEGAQTVAVALHDHRARIAATPAAPRRAPARRTPRWTSAACAARARRAPRSRRDPPACACRSSRRRRRRSSRGTLPRSRSGREDTVTATSPCRGRPAIQKAALSNDSPRAARANGDSVLGISVGTRARGSARRAAVSAASAPASAGCCASVEFTRFHVAVGVEQQQPDARRLEDRVQQARVGCALLRERGLLALPLDDRELLPLDRAGVGVGEQGGATSAIGTSTAPTTFAVRVVPAESAILSAIATPIATPPTATMTTPRRRPTKPSQNAGTTASIATIRGTAGSPSSSMMARRSIAGTSTGAQGAS